jgi:hypothetical protein
VVAVPKSQQDACGCRRGQAIDPGEGVDLRGKGRSLTRLFFLDRSLRGRSRACAEAVCHHGCVCSTRKLKVLKSRERAAVPVKVCGGAAMQNDKTRLRAKSIRCTRDINDKEDLLLVFRLHDNTMHQIAVPRTVFADFKKSLRPRRKTRPPIL